MIAVGGRAARAPREHARPPRHFDESTDRPRDGGLSKQRSSKTRERAALSAARKRASVLAAIATNAAALLTVHVETSYTVCAAR